MLSSVWIQAAYQDFNYNKLIYGKLLKNNSGIIIDIWRSFHIISNGHKEYFFTDQLILPVNINFK